MAAMKEELIPVLEDARQAHTAVLDREESEPSTPATMTSGPSVPSSKTGLRDLTITVHQHDGRTDGPPLHRP